MKDKYPLVIGLGNEYRGDDAVGIEIVRRLADRVMPEVSVVESSGEGTELMRLWEEREVVFLIDAIQANGEPGKIYRFTDANIDEFEQCFYCSSHLFSVPQALRMSHELGTIPDQIVIFGVAGRQFNFGDQISDKVEASIEEVISRLLGELTSLISEK